MSSVSLPEDDVPEEILTTLTLHEDPDNEDGNEHANYTPQMDFTDANNETTDQNSLVMESSGVVDVEGSSVHSKDQVSAAVHSLQGTMYVPHGALPVTDYKNPETPKPQNPKTPRKIN